MLAIKLLNRRGTENYHWELRLEKMSERLVSLGIMGSKLRASLFPLNTVVI